MHQPSLGRRNYLKLFGAAVLSAIGVESGGCSSMPTQTVKWSSGSEYPRLVVPVNATDCHHHIYDHKYPWAPEATLKPGDATVQDYRQLQARLGTTRNVLIQPSSYGTDNSLLVASIAQFHGHARGVAVVDTGVSNQELRALHAAGVRGIRFNLAPPGTTTLDMVEPLAKRIAPMGWHVQVNAPASLLVNAKDVWYSLPCPVVFDHLANTPEPQGVNDPAFRMVSELLSLRKAYVKISGLYITSKIGAPSYADSVAVAKAFAQSASDRVLWGSDWPHPTEQTIHRIPDDALLLDLLASIVPDESTRKRVLVDTPASLYQFP